MAKITRKDFDAIWSRLDEQEVLSKAIVELTIQVKLMNGAMETSLKVQKDFNSELKFHYENVDKRIRELEISPGKQALEDKKHIWRHIVTIIATGIVVFVGSLFANMAIDYKTKEKQTVSQVDGEK